MQRLQASPVILAAPSASLDLPLRVLVSAEPDGAVWMAFNDPRSLQTHHHIPPELVANIGGVGKLLDELASTPMHRSPAVPAP